MDTRKLPSQIQEREKRSIRRHLKQVHVATQVSDESEEMITQATSNQSFVVAEEEEYGGEGLADAKVVAQVTDQSTAHEKGLDEVADGDVDIAQDDEINNDELPSGEDSVQMLGRKGDRQAHYSSKQLFGESRTWGRNPS